LALIGLLEAQRKRLLEGDVTSLGSDLAEIERIGTALANETPPDEVLRRLRLACARNAALLQAGVRGVRSVRRRMRELGEVRASETYTAEGERVAMSAPRFDGGHLR